MYMLVLHIDLLLLLHSDNSDFDADCVSTTPVVGKDSAANG
jgi:hypothetical protein